MEEIVKLKTKKYVVKNIFGRSARTYDVYKSVSLEKIKEVLGKELELKDYQMEVPEKDKPNCFKVITASKNYYVKAFCSNDHEIISKLNEAVNDRNYYKVCSNVYVMVEDFYEEGKTLDECPDKSCKNLNAGKQIAQDLKDLHKYKLNRKPLYLRRLKHALQIVEKQGFNGLDKIINFAKEHKVEFEPVLIHSDMYPSNIYVAKGIVTVIDYETAGAGHPYEDFSYLMLFADQYPEFLKEVLNEYFDGKLPENFWKENAYFVAVRYILNLAETYKNMTREQVDNNTAHIIKEYLESEHPSWWK